MSERQNHDVSVQHNVAMTMRDGVELMADIYRPKKDEPSPVLLMRSPYDKSTSEAFCLMLPEWYARQGYIVVSQDTRGRFESGGDFRPYRDETADGVDTIAHCTRLAGTSGKVGMYGFSYPGMTQFLPATENPDGLVAIAPTMTGDGLYEDWTYQNGALRLAFIQSWVSELQLPEVFRKGTDADIRPALKQFNHIACDYDHLPLTDHPLLPRAFAGFYYEWLDHPTFDDYWKAWHLTDRYKDIAVPALHMGGWYDLFAEGTIRNFQGLREDAATERAREGQKLVMGPWYHQPWGPAMGALDFGDQAASSIDELTIRWYDHWLKGIETGIMEEPAVSIFVMGANRWRHGRTFPLPETRPTTFHLHSDGRANSVGGNGRLSNEPPSDEPCDIYAYDPFAPISSLGGRSCCPPDRAPMGPLDQRPIENDPGVLVYTGPLLEKDLEICGAVDTVIFAASSGSDTDFTVKLVDVHPDGAAINLVDGIIRASFRDGNERPAPIEPGRVYRYAFRVGHIANRFLAGHRIRVEVSSSNFPQYERSLNCFHPAKDATYSNAVAAIQKIFHDGAYPSHVILPVVPID